MHICPEGQWRCNDGQCVDPVSRCDGRIQCRDKSDEVGCHYNTTPRKSLYYWYSLAQIVLLFTKNKHDPLSLDKGIFLIWKTHTTSYMEYVMQIKRKTRRYTQIFV